MNLQTKALFALAAAVVAHPFIVKGLDGGFSRYASRDEAQQACDAAVLKAPQVSVYAEEKDPDDIFGGGTGVYSFMDTTSQRCIQNLNNYELVKRPIRRYESWYDYNTTPSVTVRRFYF